MKTTAALKIGADLVHVSDYHLLLELGACGRGYLTAELDADCTGSLVRFDLGVGENVYRWFTGYVERCGDAERGFKRLFVRELAGSLNKVWPVSLQHPTLREVCAALSALTDLQFSVPAAEYADTKIPHFKSAGKGFALLDSLGGAFSIPDYCWQQLPDGVIYVGSYNDSRFARADVEIPTDFIKMGSAGNGVKLAIIPAIRPGVVVNGQRITQVEIENGDMQLRWTPKNSAGQPAWESPEKRQIDKAYPELSAGLHLPRRARVTGSPDAAALGDVHDPFRPRYAANLQLLDADGNDADMPELIAVPLPVPFAGNEGGLFQFPAEGAIVEVGFSDGRPDKPMIRQTLQDGQTLPAIQPGEQLQQQRAGVSQRITREGSWQRETDQAIEESSASRVVVSDSESRQTTTRTTTVKGNDSLTVLGSVTLMAGAVLQLSDGDYCIGAENKFALQAKQLQQDIESDAVLTVGGALTEKITGIRKSVAAAQVINGQTVNIGDGEINILDCLTDTLDVLQELAELTAQHAHSNTGTPTNSGAISANAQRPGQLSAKYKKLIA
ncbi:hypothetical protein DAI21_10635 [Lelliottia sp. WB101]|uniref:hypothetical protein n=1 Tax=Lelliottia sp. WB101 TaxID=2153385 RepID=UPI000D21832D|nr:hypothetical protein [Lelliottia sp. WB101]AVY98085.1 hypothetical protein DAI21_10635 [Lelliottia sp. WB101]